MPYIQPKDRFRDDIERVTTAIGDSEIKSIGELNYLITTMCHRFLEVNGECYANHNQIIGVLECAQLEYYRRLVSKYEDRKIEENGDVLPQKG